MDILSQIRRQGATPNPEQPTPEPRPEPLPPSLQAARDGNLPAISAQLETGTEIDLRDQSGSTALCHAIRNNYSAVAHFLIDAGADVECREAEMSPLLMAVEGGNTSLVKTLLTHGADIGRQSRQHGWSVLMKARTEEMIALLVSEGASFKLRNRAGHTAIQNSQFQADAIRRNQDARVRHYEEFSEMAPNDAERQRRLLLATERSLEPIADEHEDITNILKRHEPSG